MDYPWRSVNPLGDSLAAHEPPSAITIVACDAGGSVVGFVSGGKERTGQLGYDGELYAIYLRQEAQRKGLGALLVRQFAHELRTDLVPWPYGF